MEVYAAQVANLAYYLHELEVADLREASIEHSAGITRPNGTRRCRVLLSQQDLRHDPFRDRRQRLLPMACAAR